MKGFLKRNCRAIFVFSFLLVLVVILFIEYRSSKDINLPNVEFTYDYYGHKTKYELDDYIVEEKFVDNGKKYILTEKNTGATRTLFNDPFMEDRDIGDIVTYGNKFYYSRESDFYCYDIDTDTITKIYSHFKAPIKVEVFDVRVYYKSISYEEIETYVNSYIIYKGDLLVCTNRAILRYDGRSTETLIRGEYYVERFEDGILTMYTESYYNSNNELVLDRYQYNVETGKITRIDE